MWDVATISRIQVRGLKNISNVCSLDLASTNVTSTVLGRNTLERYKLEKNFVQWYWKSKQFGSLGFRKFFLKCLISLSYLSSINILCFFFGGYFLFNFVWNLVRNWCICRFEWLNRYNLSGLWAFQQSESIYTFRNAI